MQDDTNKKESSKQVNANSGEDKDILVIYYSRTGNTEKIAKEIASRIDCDIEEVIDTRDRSGFLGYIIAGFHAALKKLTELEPLSHNVDDYSLVIVGSPVWAFNVSTPIRTFLTEHKEEIGDAGFFVTAGGSGCEAALSAMEEITNKTPRATLEILQDDFKGNTYETKVDDFVESLT